MRYANFHTHTLYSDGNHSLEENVLSAIKKNMSILGFSDHSFTACDTSYCMKKEDYETYCKEIRALKEKYADRLIQLALGKASVAEVMAFATPRC